MKLLIVDDEPRITESLSVLFKSRGVKTLTACDGVDAINVIKASSVKVVVSDIQMPNMDGFDLLKAAKQIDPFVQFIFLTGYANLENTKKAFKGDAFEFYKKPIADNSLLFEMVEKAALKYDQLKTERNARLEKQQLFSALTTIFDSFDAVVYVSDMETYELIYTNKQFNKELNFPEEKSFVGYKCWDIIHGLQDGPCSFCTNPRLLEMVGSSNESYEWDFFNENTQKHYRIIDKAIEWLDGRLVRLEIAYDISTKKRYDRLQKKYDKTQHTIKKLESMGTLSGGIAHQFNNALSVITGHLNLIEMDFKEEKRLNLYIKKMGDSAKKMTDLTSLLLAYARGGKYQAQSFKITAFLKEMIEKFQQDLPLMLTFIDKIPEMDCLVKADKNQFKMLVLAVLKNAVEATQEVGTIEILCEKENPDQSDFNDVNIHADTDYISIKVTDDGSGMGNEVKERIFEPFFTTKDEGRGLGMSAAYGIVKNHNGYISVHSKLEKGSTVKIYLPIIQSASDTAKDSVISSASKDITVLLIEDDEAVMNVMSMMLKRSGYNVLLASTGKDAVELARLTREKINIALLDFVLPDMNGDIIYPLIQENHPEMKVIILSGYAVTDSVKKTLDAGATCFLQKPVSLMDLSQKIKELL